MVVAMRQLVRLGIISMCLSFSTGVNTAFGSVQLIGESVRTIRPCQAAFFVVEIAKDDTADGSSFKQLATNLMNRVVINGRGYEQPGLTLGLLNYGALLYIDDRSLRFAEDHHVVMRVPLMLYFDLEDRAFLFHEPGRYQISVGGELDLSVIVEQPTEEEVVIIEAMNDMEIEFMMWVMKLGNERAPAVEKRVEELLEAYPNTAYTEMLTVCLGHTKMPKFKRRDTENIDATLEAYRQERLTVAKKYFAPYCNGPIQTPYQSVAAYKLAQEIVEFERHTPPEATDEKATLRQRAKELLEKVRDSGYTAKYREAATQIVSELSE